MKTFVWTIIVQDHGLDEPIAWAAHSLQAAIRSIWESCIDLDPDEPGLADEYTWWMAQGHLFVVSEHGDVEITATRGEVAV